MKVLAVTTTIRSEMVDICAWLMKRQTVPVDHVIHFPDSGEDRGRWGELHHALARAGQADYFMLVDDDDYIGPQYLERCLERIGRSGVYGEIPSRVYHVSGRRYGEGRKRTRLFSTFSLFADRHRKVVLEELRSKQPALMLEPILRGAPTPQHAEDLVIIRGAMRDPATAITRKKNIDATVYPEEDPDLSVLKAWVGDDAAERYLACSSS